VNVRLCERLLRGALVAALGLASAAAAFAQTTFFEQAALPGFAVQPCNGLDPAGNSTTLNTSGTVGMHCGPNGGDVAITATGSAGHTGAFLHAFESGGGSPFGESLFHTDVVFHTSNPNAPQGPATISMNLAIAGSTFISGVATASWTAFASVESTNFSTKTDINTDLNSRFFVTTTPLGLNFTQGGQVFPVLTDVVSGVLTTDPVANVPLNVPVNIGFGINVTGFAFDGTFDAQFLESVDFPRDVPVFNLPDGVTADDPEAFIFDNRYLPPVAAVPEPSVWASLAVGLWALGLTARRTSRRRRPGAASA
jgi:hypothetical protein